MEADFDTSKALGTSSYLACYQRDLWKRLPSQQVDQVAWVHHLLPPLPLTLQQILSLVLIRSRQALHLNFADYSTGEGQTQLCLCKELPRNIVRKLFSFLFL